MPVGITEWLCIHLEKLPENARPFGKYLHLNMQVLQRVCAGLAKKANDCCYLFRLMIQSVMLR